MIEMFLNVVFALVAMGLLFIVVFFIAKFFYKMIIFAGYVILAPLLPLAIVGIILYVIGTFIYSIGRLGYDLIKIFIESKSTPVGIQK